MYWGVEAYLHAFLTSELDGSEWSASLPAALYHRENNCRYPLDTKLRQPVLTRHRKDPNLCRVSKSRRSGFDSRQGLRFFLLATVSRPASILNTTSACNNWKPFCRNALQALRLIMDNEEVNFCS